MIISSSKLADSLSPANIRLLTYEIQIPSGLLAELLSNRDLSVTVAGGYVQKPMTAARCVVTATEQSIQAFIVKYGLGELSPSSMTILVSKMEKQLTQSEPSPRGLEEWHLPYIDFHTVEEACLLALNEGPPEGLTPAQLDIAATNIATKISVVRCHRAEMLAPPKGTPYKLLLDYYRPIIEIYNALAEGTPLSSAFEHQAQPDYINEDPAYRDGWAYPHSHGNLKGWRQHRRMFIEPALANYLPTYQKKQQQEHTQHG